MPLQLPRYIHIQGSADITWSVVQRWDRDEPGHSVNGIISRIPPEPVCASIHSHSLRRPHGEVRMDTNNVLWPNQAGIVEIPGFAIQRVEGFELSILWVMVAAGDSRLQPKSWLPGCFERVTAVDCRCPSEN